VSSGSDGIRARLIRDIVGRLAIVAGYAWQSTAIVQDRVETGRVSNLLFLTTSGWNIILWLVADGAQMWRTSSRSAPDTWRISSESAGA
jgi:hypothetical protein